MTQQSVVITGGTQGLGFGYAREFLQRGCHVTICGRTAGTVAEAVARLRLLAAGGASVAGRACEMANIEDVQALWNLATAEFGRVDVWLNNAGYARTGADFADTTPQQIEAMVRGNVIGSINAAQVVIAGMKQQQGDTSIVGSRGRLYLTLGGGGASGRVVPGMTVYSTTKRAVKYLAGALVKERREARDDSILIGTISPGVNITEGMLREFGAVSPAVRTKALKQLNFIGEHVETTTPWIVERILADRTQGNAITWLTTGRLARRAFAMLFGAKRDVLSRYGLKA